MVTTQSRLAITYTVNGLVTAEQAMMHYRIMQAELIKYVLSLPRVVESPQELKVLEHVNA